MKLILEKHIDDDDWESEGDFFDALVDLVYEYQMGIIDGAKWRIIGDNEQIAVVRESSLAPQFSIDSDEYEEEEEDEDGS